MIGNIPPMGYTLSEKCYHPISAVYDLIGEPPFHRDYCKELDGLTYRLHLADEHQNRYRLHMVLAVFDDFDITGSESAIFDYNMHVLELCSTHTCRKYRGRGLARMRLKEMVGILDGFGFGPDNVMIRPPMNDDGKSFAAHLGLSMTDEGIMECPYGVFRRRLFQV